MKAVVVGRHTRIDLGNEPIEVISAEDITFSTDLNATLEILRDLQNRTISNGVADTILLQNIPGIVGSALVRLSTEGFFAANPLRWGVIVSKPGERQANVTRKFHFDASEGGYQAEQAVKFANVRAVTQLDDESSPGEEILSITVDPVTPYFFSHVEWFNTPVDAPKQTVFEFPSDPDSAYRREVAAAAARKAAEAVKFVSPAAAVTVEDNVLTVTANRGAIFNRDLAMKLAKAADAYHFVINGALKRFIVDSKLPEGEYTPVVRRVNLLNELAQAMGEPLDIFLVIDEDGDIRFTDFLEFLQNHGISNSRDWAVQYWHNTHGNMEDVYAAHVTKALKAAGLPANEKLIIASTPVGNVSSNDLVTEFISSGKQLLEKDDKDSAFDAFFAAFQLQRWGFLR